MRRQRWFFRSYSRVYDYLWDHALTEALATRVAGCLENVEGPVLEIGSGTGLIIGPLRRAGLHVVPSEPDASMRSRLRRRFPELECAPWSLEEAERTDGGYGAVAAVNVLHMVANPGIALTQMIELCRPGGIVVVGTPAAIATLPLVVSEMRAHGVGLMRRCGFLLVHLGLSPLRAIVGAGIARNATIEWPIVPDFQLSVGRATDLLVWRIAARPGETSPL